MTIILDRLRVVEKLWTLAQCQTVEQIKLLLAEITLQLSCDYFFYRAHFILERGRSLDRVLNNYPLAWRQKYKKNDWISIDPLMHHARHKLTPLILQPNIYITAEQKILFEEAKQYGLSSGVSFPVHNREGDIGILSLVSGANCSDAHESIQENLLYGPLIANFIHDAMHKLVNKTDMALVSPLSPRELECLKWIAAGKSTWETARILNLSEHGVIHHVRNIMFKFSVTSRHQAVSRAIACGLV